MQSFFRKCVCVTILLLPLLFALPLLVVLHRISWLPSTGTLLTRFIPFSRTSRSFSEDMIPDLTGKVALVTGGSSGIGFETSKALAAKGAQVVLTSRSAKRGELAKEAILHSIPEAEVESIVLDLASLENVKRFTQEFLMRYSSLHILVLNAGKFMEVPSLSSDGFEWMFGVHHMGHFYLTHLLADVLKKSADATRDVRIVVVAGWAHHLTPPEGIDLKKVKEKGGRGMEEIAEAYGTSKLANIWFAREMARRVQISRLKDRMFVNSLHPGEVRTNVSAAVLRFAESTPHASSLLKLLTLTPTEGALSPLFLATSPSARSSDGFFFPVGQRVEWGKETSRLTVDRQKMEELWTFSVEELKDLDPSFETGF